ncbi:MAG: hypothetical protein ABI155_07810 [Paralcaligenes sp.]
MKINATAAPDTGRIVGTLHKHYYSRTVPLRDENLSREKVEEREIMGPHKNSEQKDRKGAW